MSSWKWSHSDPRSITDIYWLAALLEGEGCFYMPKMGEYRCPTVQLGMTDLDVVLKARDILDPSLSLHTRRTKCKPVYTVAIYSSSAISWMLTLYKLMGERRQQKIKAIVTEWKSCPWKRNAGAGRPRGVVHQLIGGRDD